MLSKRLLACLAALAIAVPAMGGRQPGQPPRPGFNFFSKQQDIQLGQEAAQQVRQQYQVVQNSFLQSYVRRIGERLASTPSARGSGFRFTFTVLNDTQVNAFALPGGPMFIFTGLLKTVDNEAQLAGVMSHEMSHVVLRHGTHEASKANMVELPAELLGTVLGNQSLAGQLARFGVGFTANSFILKFSRDAESQADSLGAQIMSEAGYNPVELARFFEKLQASGGQGNSRLSQFLSDHPNPGNRERAIETEAAALPHGAYGYRTGDFNRAQRIVDSLPPPPARKVAN